MLAFLSALFSLSIAIKVRLTYRWSLYDVSVQNSCYFTYAICNASTSPSYAGREIMNIVMSFWNSESMNSNDGDLGTWDPTPNPKLNLRWSNSNSKHGNVFFKILKLFIVIVSCLILSTKWTLKNKHIALEISPPSVRKGIFLHFPTYFARAMFITPPFSHTLNRIYYLQNRVVLSNNATGSTMFVMRTVLPIRKFLTTSHNIIFSIKKIPLLAEWPTRSSLAITPWFDPVPYIFRNEWTRWRLRHFVSHR